MTASEKEEFFDSPDILQSKIKKLAHLIRKSKHCVVFTGAGISTSAGIRDFRSGINTCLDTGGGAWAKNTAVKEGKFIPTPKRKAIDIQKAYPTAAHLSLVQLIRDNRVQYLISQNCDGLHQRSGIPADKISELHGNSYIEICAKCNKKYMRDYRVRDSLKVQNPKEHETGRKCTVVNCNGNLRDTIVQFAEQLPQIPLARAQFNSNKADLYIAMGSSLAVSPACDMPKVVGMKWANGSKDHNLVIINLQKTSLSYKLCSLQIFAKIDEVMIGLMNELKIDIPKLLVDRYIRIEVENVKNDNKMKRLIVTQLHADGINFTFMDEITFRYNGKQVVNVYNNKRTNKAQDLICLVPVWNRDDDVKVDNDEKKEEMNINVDESNGFVMEMSFYGNFREPKLKICLNEYLDDLVDKEGILMLKITFDTSVKKWNVLSKQQLEKDLIVNRLLNNC